MRFITRRRQQKVRCVSMEYEAISATLRKRLWCKRYKNLDNTLEYRHPLKMSFSRDLKYVRFNCGSTVCCIPFSHMNGACFGAKGANLGDACRTRTISLYFYTVKSVHLELPSNHEAQQFLKALFFLKFGQGNNRVLSAEEWSQSLQNDQICVYTKASQTPDFVSIVWIAEFRRCVDRRRPLEDTCTKHIVQHRNRDLQYTRLLASGISLLSIVKLFTSHSVARIPETPLHEVRG
eukprot:g64033.t1